MSNDYIIGQYTVTVVQPGYPADRPKIRRAPPEARTLNELLDLLTAPGMQLIITRPLSIRKTRSARSPSVNSV